VVLGAVAGAAGAIPTRPAALAGREWGSLGSVSSLGRGRMRTGDGPRRRTRAAAAVVCRPARGGASWGRAWHGSSRGLRGKSLGARLVLGVSG
jgi:hypothetical protein